MAGSDVGEGGGLLSCREMVVVALGWPFPLVRTSRFVVPERLLRTVLSFPAGGTRAPAVFGVAL